MSVKLSKKLCPFCHLSLAPNETDLEMFKMRYIDGGGRTGRAVAEHFGITPPNVYRRLERLKRWYRDVTTYGDEELEVSDAIIDKLDYLVYGTKRYRALYEEVNRLRSKLNEARKTIEKYEKDVQVELT